MNKINELLGISKNEVIAFRWKILDQVRARNLDGSNFVKVTAPILPRYGDEALTAFCSSNFDVNSIHPPFFPLGVWEKITTKPMPHLFENLYPVTDVRIVGFVMKCMKCEYHYCTEEFVSFLPWLEHKSVKRISSLYLFDGSCKPSDVEKSKSPFVLPLLYSGFDIFPPNVDYATSISNNAHALFDFNQATDSVQKILKSEGSKDVPVANIEDATRDLISVLGSMNYLLDIEVLREMSKGSEPMWTKKDESFYGKVLSRIITS